MGTMIVFIDESGIHKPIDHSVFALVYIAVKDKEKFEQAVVEIEEKLNIDDFHWSEHSWTVREKFFTAIAKLPFTAKIAIFRNPVKTSEAREWSLVHLMVEKDVDQIHIDGKQPRWIEHQLKKVLRDKGTSVRNLRTDRHSSSPGIRIADAIAGLSRAHYDKRSKNAERLWKIIRKKITAQLVGGQTDE
ncbi:MAG: DUF3800 domain-containing protein [bacterium]|nr:DUF3800 domain-containing protein [bacterium]